MSVDSLMALVAVALVLLLVAAVVVGVYFFLRDRDK